MQGISSKALAFGEPKNKEKTFQGQRFDYEIGLNWVQFKWRNHDPQIGRFIEIDPLSDDYEYNSTYAFSENKVISHVELEGLEAAAVIWPRDLSISDQDKQDFYRAYNQSLDKGATNILKGVALVSAIVGQPEIAAGARLLLRALKGNEDAPSVNGNKKVPSPNGRNGGEAHQSKIKEIEKSMQERGLDTKREVKIETPGGSKKRRYIDVEGKDPKTGKTEQVQVGKQNKNGTPVSRERKALDDVEKATGTRPKFEPYNLIIPKKMN